MRQHQGIKLPVRTGFCCGIDEVGRGALAGPVVAAAVILPRDFYPEGLDDSKKLSKSKREYLYLSMKERVQFGKPISSNQAIQFKLADMAIEIEASRLLIRKSAWMKDEYMNFSSIASMAKVNASEVAMRAASECVQIHGGYGYISETGVERLMRDAKITQIYEGTSEIQRIVISRSVLK